MKRKEIEKLVEQIIEPVLEELGIELVDLEFKREPKGWVLRFYIDKEDGVDLAICQEVSEVISPILDEADPVPYSYYLEVSSPGIERVIKKASDFKRFQGSKIFVSTLAPVDERRRFKGTLKEAFEDRFLIECGGKEYIIDYGNVAKAHLVVDINF